MPKLRKLALTSIEPAIKRLCEVGSWPRPPRARLLRMGHDFSYDDLKGIKEVKDLIDFLASQEKIKSMYVRNQGDEYILEDYWRRLLINILAETDGTSVRRAIFDKWFSRFLKELFTDTAVWRAVDTIDGLVLDGKELRLDEYTTLMPIPRLSPWDWLESLVPKHDKHFNAGEFLRDEWDGPFATEKVTLVVTTMGLDKSEFQPWSTPINKLNQIGRTSAALAAIRLVKPGAPCLHHHAIFQLSYFPLVDPFGYMVRDSFRGLYEKETSINKGDRHNIRSIWQELMSTEYAKPLYHQSKVSAMDIAKGRFFSSYDVHNWFENMLDLTIALEALFSPSDSQEINHRIALRCAWLLGEHLRTSQSSGTISIYSSVRAMYELRSRIVHGSVPQQKKVHKLIGVLAGKEYEQSKDSELRELAVESAREIVRRSIRACERLSKLPRNGPHWPFPNDFDQSIVIPGRQRLWQEAAGILA